MGPSRPLGSSLAPRSEAPPIHLAMLWGRSSESESRGAGGKSQFSNSEMRLEFPLDDSGGAASRGRKHFPHLMRGNLNKSLYNNRVKLRAAACNEPAHGLLMR